jgi:hypothetical protein
MNRVEKFLSRHTSESIDRKMKEWNVKDLESLLVCVFSELSKKEKEYMKEYFIKYSFNQVLSYYIY